jgi:hypothetical protein
LPSHIRNVLCDFNKATCSKSGLYDDLGSAHARPHSLKLHDWRDTGNDFECDCASCAGAAIGLKEISDEQQRSVS